MLAYNSIRRKYIFRHLIALQKCAKQLPFTFGGMIALQSGRCPNMSKIKSFVTWRHRCSATQTTLYIQYNKDHAYTPVRTQKGQRSQTVSTALSVAIITRQPYIMKAFSVAAPIYDICNMGGVKLNIRFTIIPFLMGISTYTIPNSRKITTNF